MVQKGQKRGGYLKSSISEEAKELRESALILCKEHNISIDEAVNLLLKYQGKRFSKEYGDNEIGYILGISTQRANIIAENTLRKFRRF